MRLGLGLETESKPKAKAVGGRALEKNLAKGAAKAQPEDNAKASRDPKSQCVVCSPLPANSWSHALDMLQGVSDNSVAELSEIQ
jgi:hypothetical protein